MCGICGIYGSKETALTTAMLDALSHRGPDGSKTEHFPWGSLGFCRLDIFGSSGVNQPVKTEDQKTALVFNGEIYNFNELCKLFPSKTIKEEACLILELYLAFGEKAFSRLKGMFAIAIMTQDKLLLARDTLGIKPLVYCTSGSKLYFASEIKALLRSTEKMIEVDRNALAEAAVFGFVFDLERTLFKSIKQLLPGSCLSFSHGKIKTSKFNTIKPSFYGRERWKLTETLAQYGEIMNTTSKLHLGHSKHSQAVYLSGGIDSTLMTYFLQKNTNETLDTFTLFDDKSCEDRIYASKVAAELETSHSEYKTGYQECLNFLDHYIYHYESIVTDGIFNVLGSLAFHLLSYQISKKHKVAYCGEGADELFGGYYWMHSHPLGIGDRLRARSLKINNGDTEINQYIMEKFPDDDSREADMRKEIFDLLMVPGLTNCHLWSVDRSSSAFSFEARPLFLYDDLRDWALSFSIENKVSSDKQTKLILKEFASRASIPLFKDVSARKKIGMPYALNNSLENLIAFSEKEFNEKKTNGKRPHQEYEMYLNTDIEKYMFDKFYHIFIENRGELEG
jgi:asparagine synthase (glutamine-hydrolysing)